MWRVARLCAHLITQKSTFCKRYRVRRMRNEIKKRSFKLLRFCILSSAFLILNSAFSQSCGCDESKLAFSQKYVADHKLIFRGKTVSTATGEDFSKVTFVITQLFKGSCPKEIDVYFDKKAACQLKFNLGEDWLIYADLKQMEKPFVEYCSRSRKNVINTNKNVEMQYIKSDLTVDAECQLLQEQLGLQNFTSQTKEENTLHTNIIPNFWQRIVLILCSAGGFIMIYIGANKLLKK
jgi:hypothetical protein